jgi:hypothetical protein
MKQEAESTGSRAITQHEDPIGFAFADSAPECTKLCKKNQTKSILDNDQRQSG